MIKKYLENYYNLLLEKKVNLEEDLNEHQAKLENYSNKISELKNDSKDSMLGFYPYMVDVDEPDEKEKYHDLINACEDEIKAIKNSIHDVKLELKQLFWELQGLNENKKSEDNKKSEIKEESYPDEEESTGGSILDPSHFIYMNEYEKCIIKNDISNRLLRNIDSIKKRIDLSVKIVELDPVRCKLELGVVSGLLDKIDLVTKSIFHCLDSLSFSSEDRLEDLICLLFDKLGELTNRSVEFSSSVENGVDYLSFVMKYYILFFINKLCYIFISEFHAEKISIEIKLQDESVCLSLNYVGENILPDSFGYEDAAEYNIETFYDDLNCSNISSLSIVKKQLDVLSSRITKCDYENDRNIVHIVFPLFN